MIPFKAPRAFDVACTVEIEQSAETLHAHVVLDGDVDIQPGDAVTVHDAPIEIGFGERIVVRRRATVMRGGLWARIRAQIEGYLALTDLYDVSFTDGRAT